MYGRLGSWSVEGSLKSGYGVEGEKSESFEDHFMHGVRNLVSPSGNSDPSYFADARQPRKVLEPGKPRAVRAVPATGASEEEV